jgi:hypothetical protein
MTGTFTRTLQAKLPAPLRLAFAHLPPALHGQLANPQALTNVASQSALQHRFAAFGPQGLALYRAFLHAVKVAMTAGVVDLFRVGLALAVAAFIGTFFLQEVRLKKDEFYEEEAG